MRSPIRLLLVLAVTMILCGSAAPQAGDICGSFGGGAVWASTRAIYGRIAVTGVSSGQKFPKVAITLFSQGRSLASTTVDRTGNYCFRDVNGSGGTLVVEIEGVEAGRQDLPMSTVGINQFRQDFEIALGQPSAKPGSVSASNPYPRTGKNAELFDAATAAIKEEKPEKALPLFRQIVEADPKDFVVWAKLGSVHYERNEMSDAEKAFQRSIGANPNFAPALMSLGRVYLVQKRVDPAIEMFLKATKADPNSARSFQLLGEAYLTARKGTLGVEALNEAIRLDPVGMAESHLLMALLYDRAGAKNFASREYRMFLEKVPNHADAKKFEAYIKQYPDVP